LLSNANTPCNKKVSNLISNKVLIYEVRRCRPGRLCKDLIPNKVLVYKVKKCKPRRLYKDQQLVDIFIKKNLFIKVKRISKKKVFSDFIIYLAVIFIAIKFNLQIDISIIPLEDISLTNIFLEDFVS